MNGNSERDERRLSCSCPERVRKLRAVYRSLKCPKTNPEKVETARDKNQQKRFSRLAPCEKVNETCEIYYSTRRATRHRKCLKRLERLQEAFRARI
jgi:hypothetical protein